MTQLPVSFQQSIDQEISAIDKRLERLDTISTLVHARSMLKIMFDNYTPDINQSHYLESIDKHIEKLKAGI